MTERIRWKQNDSQVFIGRVGADNLGLFRIFENDDGVWVLDTDLPGHAACDPLDPETFEDRAERWLEEFVASLGAIFPDAPEKPEVLGHPDDAAEEWLSEAYENADGANVGYERGEMIDAFHAGSDWARGQIAKFGKDTAGRWITLVEPADDQEAGQ